MTETARELEMSEFPFVHGTDWCLFPSWVGTISLYVIGDHREVKAGKVVDWMVIDSDNILLVLKERDGSYCGYVAEKDGLIKKHTK
mgnify:CR=1 FL=1